MKDGLERTPLSGDGHRRDRGIAGPGRVRHRKYRGRTAGPARGHEKVVPLSGVRVPDDDFDTLEWQPVFATR
jgi:hypothetical protein